MNKGFLFNSDNLEVYLNNNSNANKRIDCIIIKNKENLIERFGRKGLIFLTRKLGFKYNFLSNIIEDETETLTIINTCWKMMEEISKLNLTTKIVVKEKTKEKTQKNTQGKKRRERTYYLNNMFASFKEKFNNIPPQAQQILLLLINKQQNLFTEEEILSCLLENDNQILKTKQNPQRIFLYYENLLDTHGLLKKIYTPIS